MILPRPHTRRAVEVVSANLSDQPVLAELLVSYAREFSQFHPVHFQADGTFVYPHLAEYWRAPDRFPFLIRIDGAPAGFVFVTRLESSPAGSPVFDMAEFFVTRAFRRQGVGTTAAYYVWKRFPALWQVRVLEANQLAVRFWQDTISRFTGNHSRPEAFNVGNESWRRFVLDSRSAP